MPKACNVCNENPKAPGRGRRTCVDCEGRCKYCKGELDLNKRCPPCVTIRNRERYRSDPDYARRRRIANKLSLYGITREEYDALVWECCGCGVTENLAIDHNHGTGEVRGILCKNCNSAIGLLKENLETMKNLMTYLEEN